MKMYITNLNKTIIKLMQTAILFMFLKDSFINLKKGFF